MERRIFKNKYGELGIFKSSYELDMGGNHGISYWIKNGRCKQSKLKDLTEIKFESLTDLEKEEYNQILTQVYK